ncbi:armadillo-type protein [Mycena latifolia]|nr:armadillo-type protein [Mycena latifolia]
MELKTRAGSEEDARALIHSNMLYTILQLLQALSYKMDWRLQGPSEAILRNVACHSKSTSAAVMEKLVPLLHENEVIDLAVMLDSLTIVAYSSVGAEGVVAANVLHYLLEWLESPSLSIRRAACHLMGTLADHKSTAAAVIDLHPCKQLRALSSTGVAEAVMASKALIAIAKWRAGAEAAMAAHVLDHVPQWFASPDHGMRESACRLLGQLARHKSTAEAVVDLESCRRLVTVLELYPDDFVAFDALNALVSIAQWPNGAEAMVTAKVLNHVRPGLGSSWVRRSTCDLLARLARHESTAQAVARAVPRERLVALVAKREYDGVPESAAKALQALDNYLARVQAPTDETGEPNVL